jgi:hypothetical protein
VTNAYTLGFEGGYGPTIRAIVTIVDPNMRLPAITIRGSWAASSEEALQSVLRAMAMAAETAQVERIQLQAENATLRVTVETLTRRLESVDSISTVPKTRNRELSTEVACLRAKMSRVDKITNDLIDLVGDPGERT